MWLVVIGIAFIVFCVIFAQHDDAKKEQNRRAFENAKYRERYGCSLEEMREKVKNSPNIKIVADKIKEIQNPPYAFCVDWAGVYALGGDFSNLSDRYWTRNSNPLFLFSHLGISEIPDFCHDEFMVALEKALELPDLGKKSFIPYELTYYDNGRCFLRKDLLEPPKPKLEGQDW